jgi:hypothetical protein
MTEGAPRALLRGRRKSVCVFVCVVCVVTSLCKGIVPFHRGGVGMCALQATSHTAHPAFGGVGPLMMIEVC